ncbi:MAG: 23S rRNA (adenine(2503)-C(2))-methyltransferase RlmN [candidate division Zixibacteria bacterium]|nr:23S rRNA (adenine(2503)-C(2))-methyltransferase RlmN [candidate division Zixibacteria bacterium]
MADNEKINLKELTLEQTLKLAVELGKKEYSGRQLFKWIFRHGADNFKVMTDLSKPFRTLLDERCEVLKLQKIDSIGSDDGTAKTVWRTADGLFIESVLIPDEDRLTLCMSSQAGCPIGCGFCATGKMGFSRNLSSGEIYDQYMQTMLGLKDNTRITNIVFMGMGEPLLNYDNLLKATNILTDQFGAGLSAKKITISTVGLVNGIYRLADDNPRLNLAISLHTAIEVKREKLIPIASKYPLAKLKEAAVHYARVSDNRVTFEYLLIRDINDGITDAKALAEYVRGIPCKINLITYNAVDGLTYKSPSRKSVLAFRDYLYPRTPAVTLRKSKGADIAAACGQLAGRQVAELNDNRQL